MLCGLEIAHEQGLTGHSDADVATHAVIDALLGAAGMGDIGTLFPDTDPAFAGVSSLALLRDVVARLAAAGWLVGNVDLVIVAERPKLAPYRAQMAALLAAALGVADDAVGVKATTTEGMGFEGRGEGISASAVCLLERA
ncbi:MAG TPA: 2-C-methyl-D-erythritol 2,4-cyclodiphosphate synthase [Thermoleophilia bacterium]|nr:2-C-methyl-D-erythritol 2,4-cyclodiphosphate synthase [Thermoleophilia bacterium]